MSNDKYAALDAAIKTHEGASSEKLGGCAGHYSVGQELYFEWSPYSRRRGGGETVTITKVGRKWMELSNGHRVDKVRLVADGREYSSPGTAYVSRADREAQVRLLDAWRTLRVRMEVMPGDGVTTERIAEAARLLGLGGAA